MNKFIKISFIIIFVLFVNEAKSQMIGLNFTQASMQKKLIQALDTAFVNEFKHVVLVPPSIKIKSVESRYPTFPTVDIISKTRNFENKFLDNASYRYALTNLKKDKNSYSEIQNALKTLINYSEDENLNTVVNYLRKYTTKNMADQEKALREVQNFITKDSILHNHYSNDIDVPYLNTDLQVLSQNIKDDNNFTWIQKASRDSVFLKLSTLKDKKAALSFWTNTGKRKVYRFWSTNVHGDTIGSWVELLPDENHLRFFNDDDVYRYKVTKAIKKDKIAIDNKLDSKKIVLAPLALDPITRRYWTYHTEFQLGMTQVKLANWNGENSLTILANVRYFLNYNKDNVSSNSWFHYRYGFLKSGSEDLRKSEDDFEFNTRFGYKAFRHWSYSLNYNMQTQFFNGYNYKKDGSRTLTSNFMTPGYFTISGGMTYKPKNNLQVYISPIAGKWTFVRDTTDIKNRYGVDKGRRVKRAIGMEITCNYKSKRYFDVMTFESYFKGFMSYEEKDKYLNYKKDNQEKMKIPAIITWKPTFKFYINYFLNATVWFEFVYRETQSRKLQMKESLSLGLNFRL